MPSTDEFIRVIEKMDNPLDEYLLNAGQSYPWRPLPAPFHPLEAKACWNNAFHLAFHTGWDYACGYACVDMELPIPIMHAWVVDPDGYAVDPTWAGVQRGCLTDMDYAVMVNRRYFGITLPLEQVVLCAEQKTTMTVLEQHLRAQLPSRRRMVSQAAL